MAKPFDQSIRSYSIIGRDVQLAALHRACEQVAGGDRQVLLVSGEAGIGKSRLAAEAKSIATDRGWLTLEGHCFEPDSILPYAPLLDLLGTLLAKLSPAEVAEVFGDEGRDLVKILPELARWLPGLPQVPVLDPAQERRLVIRALNTVITRLADQQPVLVIIEDLHWSDDTSLDALLSLARRAAGRRLLLVLTYRDDEVNSDLSHVLATIDRERLASELKLDRLGPADVGAIVNARVAATRPTPVAVRDALYTLTDGNPFFVEEVLSALLWGLDDAAPLDWSDLLALDDLHVPRSIHDAVNRRVERLSPAARQVLQLASVAGRRWDFSLLQGLTEHDERELLGLVKELIAAQLVIEEIEDRFAFRHALTQKAVYTQLLSRERRRLHQAIAEAYDQLHAGEQDRYLADLAYHSYEAGDWKRALDYASRAGEQAMALYAPQAAIEQFSRALDAAQRLSRSPAPSLYRARGQSFETLGDFEGARSDYEAALTAARSLHDQHGEWRALLDLGLLWAGRDYEQTSQYCQCALALARTMADPVILAQSLNRVGNWYTNIERPSNGLAMHREALSIVETSGDQRAVAETLDLLGLASYVAGNPCDSMAYYTTAVERFRDLDDRQSVSWCLATLALSGGNYQTDAGATAPLAFDACEQYARLAIDIAREIGWRPGEAYALHVCASRCTAVGDYDRAFDLIRSSLAISSEIEHRQWTIAGMGTFGAYYLDLLDVDRAMRYLEDALASSQAMGSRLWVLSITPALAETHILRHDLGAAHSVLDAANLEDIPESSLGGRSCWLAFASFYLAQGNPAEALRIADELSATDPHLTAERDAPRLARLRGEALAGLERLVEAEATLRAAVEGAATLGRPAHEWRAKVALGRVLRMQRRHADADAAFVAARETIEQLAAKVPEPEVRQTFLASATALLPPPRPKTARQAAAQAYGGLTAREREVAVLVAQGLSNRAIADQLIVSEPTVATHISHVLSKLGFSSRTQVATWALEVGLRRDA